MLLGQENWDTLCDDGLDLGEIEHLFEKIAEHNGFEQTDGPGGKRLPNSGPPARRSSARR
jgi:hypothetical protein